MGALGLVGRGPRIMSVFLSIVRVSPLSDVPILISGETGTGKELVARSIHRLDPGRCHEPFIPVNCSAISAGLAESLLFGHRRGAFTGADHYRRGLIRAAGAGVLFLDEIGDLDLSLQGKLLRVLQERRVLALGEDHEVPIHARIIAATNRNLEEMVRDHTFRGDLFHRLNVLSIRMPAFARPAGRCRSTGAAFRRERQRCVRHHAGERRVHPRAAQRRAAGQRARAG